MRKQLAGYYQPTPEEFVDLWENGLIILDTNVLLQVYRVSKTTRDELLDTLRRYSGRIWIPHQVGLEYQKNRINVIDEQKQGYSDLITGLENNENAISKKFSKYKHHSFIDTKKMEEQIKTIFLTIKNDLQNLENAHPDYSLDDPFRDEITKLFDGKTGEKYSEIQLQEIYNEGKKRYELKTPPGYKDDEKSKNNDNAQFGDLIVWYQIIDKAKSSKKRIHSIKGKHLYPETGIL